MTVRPHRNFSLGAGILALALLAAPALARSADGVAVHRGAAVTTASFGGAGLEVARGAPPARRAAPAAPARPIPIAGERLWLVDEAAARLTACEVRVTTEIGRRVIRCTSRDLPARPFRPLSRP